MVDDTIKTTTHEITDSSHSVVLQMKAHNFNMHWLQFQKKTNLVRNAVFENESP